MVWRGGHHSVEGIGALERHKVILRSRSGRTNRPSRGK